MARSNQEVLFDFNADLTGNNQFVYKCFATVMRAYKITCARRNSLDNIVLQSFTLSFIITLSVS